MLRAACRAVLVAARLPAQRTVAAGPSPALQCTPALPAQRLAVWAQPRSYSTVSASMTQEQIEEQVVSILSCFDKINPDSIKLDADFQADLGIDSLDIVECVVAVEDEFAVEFREGEVESVKTPADLVKCIQRHTK